MAAMARGKAERLKQSLRRKLGAREGEEVQIEGLRALLRNTLSDREFDVLIDGLGCRARGAVPLDRFVDYIFEGQRAQAAGGGVHAVRALHRPPPTQTCPPELPPLRRLDGSDGGTERPPPPTQTCPAELTRRPGSSDGSEQRRPPMQTCPAEPPQGPGLEGSDSVLELRPPPTQTCPAELPPPRPRLEGSEGSPPQAQPPPTCSAEPPPQRRRLDSSEEHESPEQRPSGQRLCPAEPPLQCFRLDSSDTSPGIEDLLAAAELSPTSSLTSPELPGRPSRMERFRTISPTEAQREESVRSLVGHDLSSGSQSSQQSRGGSSPSRASRVPKHARTFGSSRRFTEDLASTDGTVGKPVSEKSADKQTEWAEPTHLDRSLLREFLSLDQGGKVQAEYVWLDNEYTTDGHNFDLCSKSLTLEVRPSSVADLPVWSYSGEDENEPKEIILMPRRIYKDPFRRGNNILVLADTYRAPRAGIDEDHSGPSSWNTRDACAAAMNTAVQLGEDPWFGLEQEYYLLDAKTNWPLGWPQDGYPGAQGSYFCATGATKAPGRDLVESHYRACLYAGVKIGGVNSEVAPGQWEFQIGPCVGIRAADDLWMARYLLQRIAEMFIVNVTFTPKPVDNWAGIGGHTNFSTKSTRGAGGWDVIVDHCEKLGAKHAEHIKAYGSDNEQRLCGGQDTQRIDQFSWGVGDRSASIRIPVKVASRRRGYYEDRRPAANMDPWLVTRLIVETTVLSDHTMLDCIPEETKMSGELTCLARRSHPGDFAAGE